MGVEFGGFDAGKGGVERSGEGGFGFVDEFADEGFLVFGERAHLLHAGGEGSVGANVAGLGGFKLRARFQRREFGAGLVEKGGECLLHVLFEKAFFLDRINRIFGIKRNFLRTG